MRIVMVVLSNYPADPRVRREAETLERAGIDVDVICTRQLDEKKVEKNKNVTVYRVMKSTENKETISRYVWFTFRFMMAVFIKLQYLYLKKRYKLIQIHNMPDYLVFVAIFHKIIGTPIILDLHDLSVELFESKWGKRQTKLLSPIVRLVEKISCGFANHLITTSYGFRDRLIQRGISPNKITLVFNSADTKIFASNIQREFSILEKSVKLLYHGTVSDRFGLSTAILAVSKLQNKIPGIRLNIYGKYDPSYLKKLQDMVAGLNMENSVKLGGYVSQEEIREIIDESDIGIVPYLSDKFMDLALSTKTFEYVAMKLPVVASELLSITSIFDENCVNYFSPGDHNDLAEKILEFCENPELRKSCVDNAFSVYQKYNWSVMSEHYLNLIRGS